MIPQRSGEPRELRDGETVRTEKGIIGVVHRMMQIPGPHRFTIDGISGFWWAGGTRGCLDKEFGPGDIIEILGPAEEDHGDGTVTRVVTLPVTMHRETWEAGDPQCLKYAELGDFIADGFTDDYNFPPRDAGNLDLGDLALILRPKTPPTPQIVDRIAEAIEAGEVVLPPGTLSLKWQEVAGTGPLWCYVKPEDEYLWRDYANGPLPPRQDTDPTEITRAEIDAAREKLKSKGGA